jgi:hypothetical protein
MGVRLMGFDDGFNFATKLLREKQYNEPVAVICDCGRATTDHSMREGRECRKEGTAT